MKHVAQNLPKAVYEDCVKEELEILKKAGEFGGKLCSKVTMEIIKDKLKIGWLFWQELLVYKWKFTTDRYVVYKWSGWKFTTDRYVVYKWSGWKSLLQ